MFATVDLPVWALILILGFAAVTFASHFLFPSVRWFFRKRAERAVARLNQRLTRPIEPFKLMRRQDQVVRLVYDPQVMEAVRAQARTDGVPPNVAFEQARAHAREIVPGFSAFTYFGLAIRIAQRLGQGLYDVRLQGPDPGTLEGIDPDAAIVFVMNHRSNMDYVLITWLAARHSALSYAVGEWARVWPLRPLIRAMGAYFIRRRQATPLYRAVLARHVQMAVQQGTTQAIFPEGGLSLDGAVGRGKHGLLSYIVQGHARDSGPDVVFVPVALNYDRVLEDRVLVRAGRAGTRRFGVAKSWLARRMARVGWQIARRRFAGFGQAAVSYGTPLSLRAFQAAQPGAAPQALADALMARIRAAVPVLAVPLAAATLERAQGRAPRAALLEDAQALHAQLQARGARVLLRDGGLVPTFDAGLAALRARGLVTDDGEALRVPADGAPLVAYYAASVLQLCTAAPAAADTAIQTT